MEEVKEKENVLSAENDFQNNFSEISFKIITTWNSELANSRLEKRKVFFFLSRITIKYDVSESQGRCSEIQCAERSMFRMKMFRMPMCQNDSEHCQKIEQCSENRISIQCHSYY